MDIKTIWALAKIATAKFLGNRSAKMSTWLIMAVELIFFIALLPTIVETVQTMDTAGWNFTGYAGAATLFLLIPFAVIAGYVLHIVLNAIQSND